jgi:CelD/BcsL family acetyltransferase involved in cellulose biosynthesis
VSIICIDPQTDLRWRRLVERHKSDVFHAPEWMRVLARTYDFDIQALVVLDEVGEPRSGIAYCQIEDMRSPRIVSLPFSDFCDPLVTNHDDWDCLMDKLSVEGHPITMRCLHNDIPLSDRGLSVVNRAKWHSVDLRADLDAIWKDLHSSARRAIRKAEREGVIVRIAEREEELRAFFELHLRVRKYKYHLVAQPYRFFANIWEQFIEKQKGTLMVAVVGDEIIGGVLFLEWQDKLYYKFNASDANQISRRPNDLMIWEGIKYGKARGYTYLDFGLSDWDQEGLVRYKRKFATAEKTISFLSHTPNGSLPPQEMEVRHFLTQLTDLFTEEAVPDHVTERAGEILYRFFT